MLKQVAVLLIKAYQLFISPALPPRCRFYPSCSQYAVDALHKYPFFTSIRKIIWRLLRCNPLFSGGSDPA